MTTEKKNTKKIIFALAALAAVIVVLFAVYYFTKEKTTAGSKTITVEVVHKDGKSVSFEYTTEKEYLGEVLTEEKLIDGETSEYGMFITTADGETADDSNQEWWCITKGGERLNSSVDTTPIKDGDKFELTLTVGY